VGSGPGSAGGNAGRLFIQLRPRPPRALTPEQVIEQLRPKLAGLPGIQTFLQVPPLIRIGGQLTKSAYQFTLQGPDLSELYHWGPVLERRLREVPGLEDIATDLQIANPQVLVEIDRDRASVLGLTAEQIENALYSAYGSRQVSTIYTATNQYWVILELEPRYQADPSALSLLYVRSASGRLVPLSAVTRLQTGAGPLTVNHFGQLPAVTLSFNLRPGVALGEAVSRIEQTARDTLPDTIYYTFQGAAEAFRTSLRGMGVLLLMAVLVIYMVLGILYESFLHPVTILSGLPSAGLGALIALLLFREELNLYSFVGIIMLVGIVKKNGIMMVDFALEAERRDGKPAAEAILDACRIRFRPIMMTTMAALVGVLPIALGFGAGGEARRPLGLAVEGGLLVSQLLTLYITPVYFVYLESLRRWPARRRARRETARELQEKAAPVHTRAA
jgi:HAE1 family hydrophobic/amphiphilic exporter-1